MREIESDCYPAIPGTICHLRQRLELKGARDMRVRRLKLKAFYLIPLLAAGCAQFSITVPEITDDDFAASYRNDLKTLSSDEFQGRRPGTPGGQMTIDYLVESFKAMGVEPGNNGS